MKSLFQKWGKTKKRLGIFTLIGILLVLTYSFADNDFKILKNLDIYYTLFKEVNLYYVDETDPEELVNKSIEGMLESLDPYTVFIPESESDNYKFMTTGEYGGIGAFIRKNNNNYVVSELLEGYPAHKAGIKPGDIISEIGGKPISSLTNLEIGEMLKGSPNTEIEITIENPENHNKFTKKLLREIIKINNISYFGLLNENVGYIKLSNFTTNAHLEVKNAWLSLKEQGAKSLILDLRNNPGGLLMEAINIANIFIGKNREIVRTKGKFKQWENVFITKNEPIDTISPIAVLVNKNSASASEILAGAFQDLDRAVIVGQRTFGKGLVQTTRKLSYNTQLKITTAKYYIPSGRCIQSKDYAHRDADGEATTIPDSLIHQFTTKKGRQVKDGGGIQPDITTENETLSQLALNLYTRNFIFNYATQFTNKHDSITLPSKFTLTDAEFTEFTNYVLQLGFDYTSETDDALAKLKKAAEKNNTYEKSKDEFQTLETKLKKNKQAEFETNKKEIKELVNEEIISRYYFQKGRIEYTLPIDLSVQKTLEILNDKVRYAEVFN